MIGNRLSRGGGTQEPSRTCPVCHGRMFRRLGSRIHYDCYYCALKKPLKVEEITMDERTFDDLLGYDKED